MLNIVGTIPDNTCYPGTLQALAVLLAPILSAAADSGVGKTLYIQASQPTGVPEETMWFEPTSRILKFYGKAPGETSPTWKLQTFPDGSITAAMLQSDIVGSSKLTADIRAQLAAVAASTANSVFKLETQHGGGSFGANFFVMSDGTLRASGVSKITVTSVDRYKNGTGFVSAADASVLPKRCGFSPPLGTDTVARVYTMQAATFVLTAAGAVYATGLNVTGQLGVGDSVDRTVFAMIAQSYFGGSAVLELAIGSGSGTHLSCYALTAAGKVYVWGHNYFGQLGLGGTIAGNTNQPATPTEVTALGTDNLHVVSAAAGTAANNTVKVAAYVLKTGGTVYACGWNRDGNLGDGTTTDNSSFVAISGLANITQILAVGDADHISFYAVGASGGDGKVYGLGYNNKGQLGNGNMTSQSALVTLTFAGLLVTSLSGFATLTNFSVYATMADGTLRVWGSNANKQLGLGGGAGTSNVTTPATPTVQDILSNVLFVSRAVAGGSGGKISSALLTRIFSGFDALAPLYDVYSAGSNQAGQLGIGNSTDTPDFTHALIDSTAIAEIAFGGNHAHASNNHAALLIRLNNGAALVCGYDAAAIGQLGCDASPASISVPSFLNI